MIQYTFEGGKGSRAAYERLSHWKPNDGLEMQGGWTSANNGGGFLLFKAENEAALLEFCAQFRDLNRELIITPVVQLTETIAIVDKAHKWIDSVS